MADKSEHGLRRRVSGHHDLRLDGIGDLLFRATGARVFDVGCNKGMAGYEFACNGAAVVHGCDVDGTCINVARAVFADMRNVSHRFEVVDLAKPNPLALFDQQYDITLLLAITHKLQRQMVEKDFVALLAEIAKRTTRYIGWRGPESEDFPKLDHLFLLCGFRQVQYSTISESISPAAIWRRA